jgi:hypothetical protein
VAVTEILVVLLVPVEVGKVALQIQAVVAVQPLAVARAAAAVQAL